MNALPGWCPMYSDADGSGFTRLLASESGVHVFVNSGADSESQSVRPNQNVGRSSKFHVPPEPSAFGFITGSSGSRTVYVMSLPEPDCPDLNSIDGSSWPTYSSSGLSKASAQSDEWLTHSGSS